MRLFFALAACCALGGCATTPKPDVAGTAADLLIQDDDERELGLQTHLRLVEQGLKVVSDEGVDAYVSHLLSRLTPAAQADRPQPYTLHVVEDSKANAFATAGGHVYLTTGLLLAAQDDAEVAAALAHELGHLAARHPVERLVKGMGWGKAGLMSWRGNPQRMAEAAQWLAREAPALSHRPSQERLADTYGLRYLWRGGYDGRGLQALFTRLSAEDAEAPWLKLHPVDGRRVEHLNAVVRRGHYGRGEASGVHLRAVQALLRRADASSGVL